MSSTPAWRALPTTPAARPASTISGKIVTISSFTSVGPGRCAPVLSPLAVHFQQSRRRRDDDALRADVDAANLVGQRNHHFRPVSSHEDARRGAVALHFRDLAERLALTGDHLAANQLVMVISAR